MKRSICSVSPVLKNSSNSLNEDKLISNERYHPRCAKNAKIYCVSGHVKKPGLYEFPMGIPLRELIYEHCGGIRKDNQLKAVIPGGSSMPVLRADEIDVKMDFESLMQIGSGLGAGIELGPVGGLTADDSGNVYGYASDSHQIFSVDMATGAATVLHTFDASVPVFYALAYGGGAPSAVEETSWTSIKAMFAR